MTREKKVAEAIENLDREVKRRGECTVEIEYVFEFDSSSRTPMLTVHGVRSVSCGIESVMFKDENDKLLALMPTDRVVLDTEFTVTATAPMRQVVIF